MKLKDDAKLSIEPLNQNELYFKYGILVVVTGSKPFRRLGLFANRDAQLRIQIESASSAVSPGMVDHSKLSLSNRGNDSKAARSSLSWKL
jgi:hypothetical protein